MFSWLFIQRLVRLQARERRGLKRAARSEGMRALHLLVAISLVLPQLAGAAQMA
jgi:hypothetical protein